MDNNALGARMARDDANYNRDSKRCCTMTKQQGGSGVPVGSEEDRVREHGVLENMVKLEKTI